MAIPTKMEKTKSQAYVKHSLEIKAMKISITSKSSDLYSQSLLFVWSKHLLNFLIRNRIFAFLCINYQGGISGGYPNQIVAQTK